KHFHEFTSPAPVAVNTTPTPTFLHYFKTMNDAQEALWFYVKDHDASGLDPAQNNLNALPSLDEKADNLRDRLKALIARAKEISSRPSGGQPSKEALQTNNQLVKDFATWTSDYNNWLKTEGQKYGVTETVPETDNSNSANLNTKEK